MASLPPFRWSKTLRGVEDLLRFGQRAAEFLTAVSSLRILDGQFITATFDSSAVCNARHSLGRPYRGVIVIASSNATGTQMVTVLDHISAAKVGIDTTKFVALGSPTAFSATLTLWVF